MKNANKIAAVTAIDYRARRKWCVIGLFVAVAVSNLTALKLPTSTGYAITMASGVIGIGLFVAACWAYARLRGLAGGWGILGAIVGLGVWLGIALYLLWPSIEATLQGLQGPDWDEHTPLALWAGFAAGGLLLKAIPIRSTAAAERAENLPRAGETPEKA